VTLADFRFTNTLHIGEALIRTQSVVLPSSLPAGDYLLSITADAFADVVEAVESNNTRAATNSLRLPGQLTISFSQAEASEGDPAFLGTVARNGSLAGP